ncbi:MAG: diacylglycerol kinase [Clostridia bacterium]|nr:diacylglycerol kinase [Clostridia bacterium]
MKNRNLIESFNNAINGIIYTIKNERNMKIHIAAAGIVLLSSLYFELERVEFLIVCLTVALVIICELINTAMELLVDIIVDVYHPKARIIKDVAAGAVIVSAFVALLVGYFIFFDRLCLVLEKGVGIIRHSPINITVIALVITALLTLVFKARFKKGTPFHGGMPSGHTALAFSAATAITFWSGNARIAMLAVLLSLLVLQSRIEGKIHSLLEVVAGALLGFLVTLLLFQLYYF